MASLAHELGPLPKSLDEVIVDMIIHAFLQFALLLYFNILPLYSLR